MQIVQEQELSPDEVVFLDRAIPDALAYYHFLNLPEDEVAQKKIHSLLTDVYASLPFPVIHVPVLPPDERVEFILRNL